MVHGCENVWEIILDWASEGLVKSLVEAYEQEKEETETKVFLATWKIPKLEQIFEQSIAYEASL